MNSNLPSSTGVVIRPASFNDISYIQHIAKETWPEAYSAILNKQQMEYMLELFYSAQSLQKQMHDKHHFFLALQNYSPIGFASFSHIEQYVYKLQKLYVSPRIQKSGAGKQLLQTVITVAKSMGGKTLLLNVNRNNNAQSFYEKAGFKILKEEDIDIGNGYFMNDYVMEIALWLTNIHINIIRDFMYRAFESLFSIVASHSCTFKSLFSNQMFTRFYMKPACIQLNR